MELPECELISAKEALQAERIAAEAEEDLKKATKQARRCYSISERLAKKEELQAALEQGEARKQGSSNPW